MHLLCLRIVEVGIERERALLSTFAVWEKGGKEQKSVTSQHSIPCSGDDDAFLILFLPPPFSVCPKFGKMERMSRAGVNYLLEYNARVVLCCCFVCVCGQ